MEHETLGGPDFSTTRMTWIKPSLAWMLYRSGYGTKPNQECILKIKLRHSVVAQLLSQCTWRHGQGGIASGRIQWDPERDILTSKDGKEPSRMTHRRAIQIGLSKELLESYIQNIVSIQDVTELAHHIQRAHQMLAENPNSDAMKDLVQDLPNERPYIPHMDPKSLTKIGLSPCCKDHEG